MGGNAAIAVAAVAYLDVFVDVEDSAALSADGWTMIAAEMPMAARQREGLSTCLRPPQRSHCAGGADTTGVFTTITLLATLPRSSPTSSPGAAMLYWLWVGNARRPVPGLVGHASTAIVASLFAMTGAGKDAVFSGLIYLMLGIAKATASVAS